MKQKQTASLSESLGVSRSTIQRVIHHCPGVGSELREKILTSHLSPEQMSGKMSECDVYVILPEIPAYFWGVLFANLLREFRTRAVSVKFNVYSKLTDANVVEAYLDEAVRLNARCIIIAAEGLQLAERLSRLAEDRAVFSLCSSISANNVFYFGSDRVNDGAELGQKCLELLPQARVYTVIGEDERRRKGFLAVTAAEHLIQIPCQDASAYELARRLDACCKNQKVDAVISLDGTNARTMAALKKCGIDAPVFGFEEDAPDARYPMPLLRVCQDLSKTAEEVASAAERFVCLHTYPSQKNTFIPTYIK